MANVLFDTLLKLNNNIVIDYNFKKDLVNNFYIGNKLILENVPYEDLENYLGIDDSSKVKMRELSRNLVVDDRPFSVNANFKKTNGEALPLVINGLRYDESNVLFVTNAKVTVDSNERVDYLTNTYSTNIILETIDRSIAENRQFSLFLLDIDSLNKMNYQYGENNIDMVLVKMSSNLKQLLGKDDILGRISGDKFIIVSYFDYSYDSVREKCLNIKNAVYDVDIGTMVIPVKSTVSSVSSPSDGSDRNTLIKKLKVALERGKKKGGDCFVIYDVNKAGLPGNDVTADFKFNKVKTDYTNYSIITSTYELLNRNRPLSINITDTLAVIGSYFNIDRITVSRGDPETDNYIESYHWSNPRHDSLGAVEVTDEIYKKCLTIMDADGKFKLNQVESNKNHEIYDLMHKNNTLSILSVKLQTQGQTFGIITYESIVTNRFWTLDEISALMALSKDFALTFFREYTRIKHVKEIYYDHETDIYNRLMFNYVAEEKIAKAHSMAYSVVILKVNGYKSIYNKYGREIAIKAVRGIANMIRDFSNRYGSEGVYCRSSEDTFIILEPVTNVDALISHVSESKEAIKKITQDASAFNVTYGICVNEGNLTLNDTVDRALLAVENKKTQINGYAFFEIEMLEKKLFEANLELHMGKAAEDDEFLLFLQPKLDLKTLECVGAEALTRWNFEHKKLLMPYQFIDLFERTGFINTLDFLVFENVCKYQRYNLDNGIKCVPISVNMSRNQNDYDYYLNKINSIREKYDIPANLIEIEITEGAYVESVDGVSNLIKNLHKCGYTVSMDDFGSGYSNLASLADLDFDTIKLDKSFCNNHADNEKQGIILKFVMMLSQNLGIDVLCEGVETIENKEYLKSIGCQKGQGYLFDKPIPNEEFRKKYLC